MSNKLATFAVTLLAGIGLGSAAHAASQCRSANDCISLSVRKDGDKFRTTVRNGCGFPVKSRVCYQRKGEPGYRNCYSTFRIDRGGRWQSWAKVGNHTGRVRYSSLNAGCRRSLK